MNKCKKEILLVFGKNLLNYVNNQCNRSYTSPQLPLVRLKTKNVSDIFKYD